MGCMCFCFVFVLFSDEGDAKLDDSNNGDSSSSSSSTNSNSTSTNSSGSTSSTSPTNTNTNNNSKESSGSNLSNKTGSRLNQILLLAAKGNRKFKFSCCIYSLYSELTYSVLYLSLPLFLFCMCVVLFNLSIKYLCV